MNEINHELELARLRTTDRQITLLVGIAVTIFMAWLLMVLLTGCASTKGWNVGGYCPADGYPLSIVDSELEKSTASHPYGGMVITEDCMNPDFTHEYLVTNYYPFAVPGVPTWKP